MFECIIALGLISYSGVIQGYRTVTSGFGDFRRFSVLHFHAGIDIWGWKIYGTPVYYPKGEDTKYKAQVIDTAYGKNKWPNQTMRLIIGRFCFTHLTGCLKNVQKRHKFAKYRISETLAAQWISVLTQKILDISFFCIIILQ